MTWTAIIILLFVGLLLIALEIVVLPGAIAGIIGGGMLAIGVWQSYVTYAQWPAILYWHRRWWHAYCYWYSLCVQKRGDFLGSIPK